MVLFVSVVFLFIKCNLHFLWDIFKLYCVHLLPYRLFDLIKFHFWGSSLNMNLIDNLSFCIKLWLSFHNFCGLPFWFQITIFQFMVRDLINNMMLNFTVPDIALLLTTAGLYLHFATSVIHEITTALGIYCFRWDCYNNQILFH